MNPASLDYLAERFGIRVDPQLWRRTDEELAFLEGLEHLGMVKILCTDGNLAYFQKSNGQTFDGHIQHFQGKVQPFGTAEAQKAVTMAGGEKPKRAYTPAAAKKLTAAEGGGDQSDPVFQKATKSRPSARKQRVDALLKELLG